MSGIIGVGGRSGIIDPVMFKAGEVIRAGDAASATVATTGVGFRPRWLQVLFGIQDRNRGIGFGSPASSLCWMKAWDAGVNTSTNIGIANGMGYLVYCQSGSGGVGQKCDIESFDSDGFTLDWTIIGAGAGANIFVEYTAFR